jgi:uncharacterized protein (TIGR03118 family)
MKSGRIVVACAAVVLSLVWTSSLWASSTGYQEIPLDAFKEAARSQDRKLINPWGLAFGPSTFVSISDNNSGVSTLYGPNGRREALVVKIPSSTGDSAPATPTGVVFNPNASNFDGATFIFCTEDGTISEWDGSNLTAATLKVDNPHFNSGSDPVYKGLAIAPSGSSPLLYAANFRNRRIDVFDTNYQPTAVSGGFANVTIPSDFAPFNITELGGKLYVAYAMQDTAMHDPVNKGGNGFIGVFDLNGTLLAPLVSNGPLNSPWGMALAPPDFGPFSNTLLIGNFGDGTINAFDPATGASMGSLDDKRGKQIIIDGLWSLVFGNGTVGATNTLFFTAGPKHESRGLFGVINAIGTRPSACGGCHSAQLLH